MELIKNTEFGGERPLFASHNLHLDHVIIRAGESAIKECSNIRAILIAVLKETILSGMYMALASRIVFSMLADALPCGIPIIFS